MKSKNKKGFQESFTWIFAIFVGGLILIFAVFFAVKMIGTNEPIQNTKTSQELVAIFEKLQTGSEDEKTDRIELVKETRIYTDCSSSGDFGENRIQISERSSFGGDWSKKGGGVSSMHNQYLFAEEMIQGKDLYFLIIPFNMPYKTADMMIMYSQEYCFVNPPEIIEEFIEDLNSERTKLKKVHRISDCESEDVKVCFSNSNGCDVIVKDRCNGDCEDFERGIVEKDGERIYFVGNLIYGAIFSSVENYECGVERLMMRLAKLSELYSEKARFVSIKGCETDLAIPVSQLANLANNYYSLEDLMVIKIKAEDINEGNEVAECQLF